VSVDFPERVISVFPGGIEMRLTSCGGGASEVALDVKPEHHNPVGVLHGGAVFTLVDTGMACALMELLEPGETCVSIEIKVNNLAPVRDGRVVARTVVLQRGRTIATLDTEVRTAQGKIVAKALGTFFVKSRPAPMS
jgi:acyl-CoA thioesterase